MDKGSTSFLHEMKDDVDMSHDNLAHLFFDIALPLATTEITPLMIAAAKNDLASLETHVSEYHSTKTSYGITALMFAAAMGKLRAVEYLSKFEAGHTDHHGRTALMFAAENRQLEVIRLLAPYEARNQTITGTTALMMSVRRNHTDGAQLLSNYEAGMQDSVGFTALMLAAERDYFKIIKILLDSEARMVTNKGITALMIAVTCNKRISSRILALKEAGMQCGHGLTALMMAANNGNVDLVDLLKIDEGGLQTEHGTTALMNAVIHRHIHVIRLLIDQEARLQNKNGQTATMLAARDDYFEGVKELGRYEAGIRDNKNMTAYEIARELGHQSIVDYLEPLEGGNVSKAMEDALALLSSSLQLNNTPSESIKRASLHETSSVEKFTYTPDATYFIPASPVHSSILHRRTRPKSASIHHDDVSVSDLFHAISETNPSRHNTIRSDRFSIDSNESNLSPAISTSTQRFLRSSILNNSSFTKQPANQDASSYTLSDTLLLHQQFRSGISQHLKTTTELARILAELKDRHQESATLFTALQRQIGVHLQFTSSFLDFVTDVIEWNNDFSRPRNDIHNSLMTLVQQLNGNEITIKTPSINQKSILESPLKDSLKNRVFSFITHTKKIFNKLLKGKDGNDLKTVLEDTSREEDFLKNTCVKCGASLTDLLQVTCPLCS